MTFVYDISKIARRQAELGLTDLEVARRARIHPSTVKNVRTGKTQKPPTVRRIAEVLGIELSTLVVAEAT